MVPGAIRKFAWGLTFTLFLIGQESLAQQDDPRSSSDFYLQTFGELDPAGFPLTARVQSIFDRLLRVADKAEYKAPELLLVNSDN